MALVATDLSRLISSARAAAKSGVVNAQSPENAKKTAAIAKLIAASKKLAGSAATPNVRALADDADADAAGKFANQRGAADPESVNFTLVAGAAGQLIADVINANAGKVLVTYGKAFISGTLVDVYEFRG